jgi:hypothetical protein
MKRTVFAILVASAVLFAFAVCLADLEPCEDYPIQVYDENQCGLGMWIQVEDSLAVCQLLCLYEKPDDPRDKCGVYPSWIGGTVIFDENAEHGFRFDPTTIMIAEITPEAIQTNICQIAENPKYYDGGNWVIPYNVTDLKKLDK